MKTLVIATTNRGKLHEILQILGPDICLKPLADFPNAPEVVEDGDTFEANAIKKASIIAEHTGLPTLADDSGLEVDALNGAPGIYSARFSGKNATDQSNNTKLLCLLKNTPKDQRTARFRCAIAIVSANGTVQTTEAAWEGHILRSPRGEHGFGYDPLFLIPNQNCTSAELPTEQKNRLSHRGQALRAAKPLILNALEHTP